MDTRPARQPPLLPATILILEHHSQMVDILASLLKRNGLNGLSAYHGSGCLAFLQEQRLDVVILYIMMPKMDGLTVSAELEQLAITSRYGTEASR